MSKEHDLERLRRTGVVAIIRSPRGELLADVAAALLAGGIEVIEITFTVPKAAQVLETIVSRLGDRVLLGAGTILDAETARVAIDAGARFLVSPVVREDVIRCCRRYDRLAIPGGFTPSEILGAWEMGADLVKVFPTDFTGPNYLRILRGPLPQVRLLPTGGVTLENMAGFLEAGAFAVGVGTSLVEPQALEQGDLQRIELQARRYAERFRQVRGTAA